MRQWMVDYAICAEGKDDDNRESEERDQWILHQNVDESHSEE